MERKRYAFASTVPALSFAVARRYCTSTTTMMPKKKHEKTNMGHFLAAAYDTCDAKPVEIINMSTAQRNSTCAGGMPARTAGARARARGRRRSARRRRRRCGAVRRGTAPATQHSQPRSTSSSGVEKNQST